MLASASPEAGTAWAVVQTLGVLLAIAASAFAIVRGSGRQQREICNQPLRVELSKDFPTRPEFDRLDFDVREIRDDFRRLTAKLDAINQANEERASKLHKRIDELPTMIIATLRNTGNLK